MTFHRAASIAGQTLAWLTLPVILLLFLAMFFGPPIEAIIETIDLVQMTRSTTAIVRSVNTVEGNHATARPAVRYEFVIEGKTIESTRMLPGWDANHTTWTGGGAAARRYAVGQRVRVFYAPSDPTRCALERAWFNWPVGFTAALWGMILSAPFQRRSVMRSAMAGTTVYGFALIFFGPMAVRPSELHYHFAAWLTCVLVVRWWTRRSRRAGPGSAVVDDG